MRKLLFIAMLLICSIASSQQKYAHWTLEMGIGPMMATSSLGNSTKGLNINVGSRYAFNERFGIGTDLAFNKFGGECLGCEYVVNTFGATIEPYVTVARVGQAFTLNTFAGAGGTYMFLPDETRERVWNLTAGATALFRLEHWGAIKLTLRTVTNHGQDKSFNLKYRPNTAFQQSQFFMATVGFTVTLDNHAGASLHYDFWKRKRKADWSKNNDANLCNPLCEKNCTKHSESTINQNINNNTYIDSHDNYVFDDLTPRSTKTEFVDYVYFKEGKFELIDHEMDAFTISVLQKAVMYYSANTGFTIFLEGFACGGHGSKEFNKALSLKRAEAVRAFLKKEFVKRSMMVPIKVIGHGVDPHFKNQDINKRVKITIKFNR